MRQKTAQEVLIGLILPALITKSLGEIIWRPYGKHAHKQTNSESEGKAETIL